MHLCDGSPKLVAILLATALLFLVTVATAEGRKHPLMCKGGQHTILGLTPTHRGTEIYIGFKRGDQPANAGLEPGTCAWPDRAMGENDAIAMTFFAPEFFVKVSLNEHFSSYQPIGFGPDSEARGKLERELWYLLTAIKDESEFMVYVDSRTDGIFEITWIGP